MRLIDGNELKKELKQLFVEAYKWRNEIACVDNIRYERADGEVAAYIEAIMTVNNAPTVEAIPVIKCKECKFNKSNYIPCEDSCFKFADLPISKDFYCACGEIFID